MDLKFEKAERTMFKISASSEFRVKASYFVFDVVSALLRRIIALSIPDCSLPIMILLFMVLYPYSSGAASWSPETNPTRAFVNPVDLAPPQVTPGPEIDSKGIFARANIATCGYVSGNAGEKSKKIPISSYFVLYN